MPSGIWLIVDDNIWHEVRVLPCQKVISGLLPSIYSLGPVRIRAVEGISMARAGSCCFNDASLIPIVLTLDIRSMGFQMTIYIYIFN